MIPVALLIGWKEPLSLILIKGMTLLSGGASSFILEKSWFSRRRVYFNVRWIGKIPEAHLSKNYLCFSNQIFNYELVNNLKTGIESSLSRDAGLHEGLIFFGITLDRGVLSSVYLFPGLLHHLCTHPP